MGYILREVFLNNLPTKDGVGKNIGRKVIDWFKSIGYKINFTYDDITGEMEILDYQKEGQYLFIKYDDKEFKIKTNNIQKGSIGGILNRFSKDFKVEIGQTFKDNKRDIIIIDREYRKKEQKPDIKGRIYSKDGKWYKYHCNKCGYDEGWIEEGSLTGQNCGCSCCYGRTAVLGINTIWDTDREWVEKFGISNEDAQKYTSSSHQTITVKCPYCGTEKKMQIYSIKEMKTIACICNSSGISYPEKFMAEVLNQLKVKYIYQLTKSSFKWCNDYKYDFYLSDHGIVIETHGEQHYKDCKWSKVIDVQKNDTYKNELAIENNIKTNNYITIDCRYSNLEWIKTSILNSELNRTFDLSKIDWLKCEEFALNNKVKEVCDYWNNKEKYETSLDLAKKFKISDVTVRKYLNKGTKLNWCDYDGKKEMSKVGQSRGKLSSKEISIYKDGTHLGRFNSCTELSKKSENIFGVKLNIVNISQVCTGQKKSHKGFTFQYIEDTQSLSI